MVHPTKDEAIPDVGIDSTNTIGLLGVNDYVVSCNISKLQFRNNQRNHRCVGIGYFVEHEDILFKTPSASSYGLAGVRIYAHANCPSVIER